MALDKKHLAHIAGLARLKLTEHEEEKFLHDLGKILEHFKELQEVNTENVVPMAGGTELTNISRADAVDEKLCLPRDRAVEQFPESEGGFLKVPPVFEE